jgi:hypothetical protein
LHRLWSVLQATSPKEREFGVCPPNSEFREPITAVVGWLAMSDIFKGVNENTRTIHFTAESEAAIDWMTLTYQDTGVSFSEGAEGIKAFEAAAAEKKLKIYSILD